LLKFVSLLTTKKTYHKMGVCVLKEAALDLILTSLNSTHKKSLVTRNKNTWHFENITATYQTSCLHYRSQNQTMKLLVLGIQWSVIWISYWTCSYNESSIHPSIHPKWSFFHCIKLNKQMHKMSIDLSLVINPVILIPEVLLAGPTTISRNLAWIWFSYS